MNIRRLLWVAPVLGAAGLGLAADRLLNAAAPAPMGGDPKPAATLPISQVVLFNSGVGYFARAGEVEGDARVDLAFQESDINDLLKSMTLQDFDGGRIAAVSYDSREPVARTLASFAVDLNANPTMAGILSQARGEKVEIVLQPTANAQPGTLSGTIVGLEKQKLPMGTGANPPLVDCDVLNVLTADGLRAIKMPEVLRLRFQNPVLEGELKRALEVLALNHDAAKKAVSLHFAGDGRRKVKVGYVVEAPIWKTSYRLVLDKDGKPYLQGWAIVENPTDEDWAAVKMALVSGRPISFKMDLYNPLFVPRPTVEPELFASLRPPAYEGGFDANRDKLALKDMAPGKMDARSSATRGLGMVPMAATPAAPSADGVFFGRNAEKAKGESEQRRRFAGDVARELGERLDLQSVTSSATASKLGDFFQYAIDHPVSLARQKSALLPIVGKDVEGTRLSIYNPAVQAKHPLLGLRFKNTTGVHLSQGPITVFEGSTYAGDSRVLDIQPNEERLIAYAIDLATEVIPQNGPGTSNITTVKANKGIVHTTRRFREEKVYKITNRADTDRTLVIEHPNRTNQQFKVIETPKPVEETAELLRFQLPVAAGKSEEFKVVEERHLTEQVLLTNSSDDQIRFLINLTQSTPELKKQLTQALGHKAKWDAVRRELAQVVADVQRITADQDRIRKNLRETPPEAEVYKTYLKKLSDQEKEIDTLTTQQKKLMGDEFSAKKTYEDYLGGING